MITNFFCFLFWKGVSFFGPRSEYVVSGSDCGHVFIWSKEDGKLQTFLFADETGLDEFKRVHTPPLLLLSFYYLLITCLFSVWLSFCSFVKSIDPNTNRSCKLPSTSSTSPYSCHEWLCTCCKDLVTNQENPYRS